MAIQRLYLRLDEGYTYGSSSRKYNLHQADNYSFDQPSIVGLASQLRFISNDLYNLL